MFEKNKIRKYIWQEILLKDKQKKELVKKEIKRVSTDNIINEKGVKKC